MSRCRDCIHDGCCDGLHYCCGRYFTSRWTECAQCGREMLREDAITDADDHAFCSEECAEAWENENWVMENAED